MKRQSFRKWGGGEVVQTSTRQSETLFEGQRRGHATADGARHELAFNTPKRARAQSPSSTSLTGPAIKSGVLSQSASRQSKAQPGTMLGGDNDPVNAAYAKAKGETP